MTDKANFDPEFKLMQHCYSGPPIRPIFLTPERSMVGMAALHTAVNTSFAVGSPAPPEVLVALGNGNMAFFVAMDGATAIAFGQSIVAAGEDALNDAVQPKPEPETEELSRG